MQLVTPPIKKKNLTPRKNTENNLYEVETTKCTKTLYKTDIRLTVLLNILWMYWGLFSELVPVLASNCIYRICRQCIHCTQHNCICTISRHWHCTQHMHCLHWALCRVSLKAPLVMKQLLPPIFLFHCWSYTKFIFLKFFSTFFSTPGNFLTVRDPPYGKKFENRSECWFW